MYEYVYVCMYECVNMCMYVCMYVCVCVYVRMYVCMYVSIYDVYIYIHSDTHKYIYIYVHQLPLFRERSIPVRCLCILDCPAGNLEAFATILRNIMFVLLRTRFVLFDFPQSVMAIGPTRVTLTRLD